MCSHSRAWFDKWKDSNPHRPTLSLLILAHCSPKCPKKCCLILGIRKTQSLQAGIFLPKETLHWIPFMVQNLPSNMSILSLLLLQGWGFLTRYHILSLRVNESRGISFEGEGPKIHCTQFSSSKAILYLKNVPRTLIIQLSNNLCTYLKVILKRCLTLEIKF